MDQRLKERLIGAVVLVALAVWLIPWLLDGPEREQGADTVALNLPAAEETAPTKSVTIDLDDRARPEVPADNAATAGDAADSTGAGDASSDAARGAAADADDAARADAATPPGADARAVPSSSAEAEADASSADAAPARTAPAEADSAPPADADAADAEPTDAEPAADAAARAPSDADGGSAAAAQDEWAVQLGSFGEAANAERLAARVEMYGYEPDVSTYRSGGRDLHRVRVGPQPSRARAEAVASALSAHGFVAQVVTAD